MSQTIQHSGLNNLDVAPVYRDHAVVLQTRETPTDCLQREPQVTGNFLAAHRQLESVRRKADVAKAFAKAVQEQGNSFVGLATTENFHVFLVSISALPHHPQQLLLKAWKMRGNSCEFVEADLAHVGSIQGNGFATMCPRPQGIETYDVSGQMKAKNLFFAVFTNGDCLEGAVACNKQRSQRIAEAKQPVASLHGSATAHNVIQSRQILGPNSSGQAQLLQGAVGAAGA